MSDTPRISPRRITSSADRGGSSRGSQYGPSVRTRSRSPGQFPQGNFSIVPTASAVDHDRDELTDVVDREPDVLVASPVQQIVAVGDARSPGMMQAIRSELAEMNQAYQAQVQYYHRQFQEYDSRRTLQAHLEMTEQQNQFSEAALNYQRQAAIIAEERIAQERTEHQTDRLRQD